MELRLLGPVEVHLGSEMLDAGPPQQRMVAAALAVDAGRLVTPPALIDRVWDDAPPAARQALHAHVARIRKMLAGADGQVRLAYRSGGYVLEVDPDRVDLLRFRKLVRRAMGAGVAESERASLIDAALRLWRGEPLAGASGQWATQVRQLWYRERLDAAMAWAHAVLRIGDPEGVVSRLQALVVEYPLAEHLTAMLMRALYAAGRNAEALGHYDDARRRLADELGASPGSQLQRVHSMILRGG